MEHHDEPNHSYTQAFAIVYMQDSRHKTADGLCRIFLIILRLSMIISLISILLILITFLFLFIYLFIIGIIIIVILLVGPLSRTPASQPSRFEAGSPF